MPKWKMMARVTKKNAPRTFKYRSGAKAGEEGHLFSIDLVDTEGKETRGTFFGESVDNFYELLQDGRTYMFSGGMVKKADQRFCHCELEITFDKGTVIQSVDDDGRCPQMVLKLRPLSDVEALPIDSLIDVMAVVSETERPMDVNLKKGGTKRRMNVTILDDSGVSVRLTLWGEFADMPFYEGTVALFKGLKVSDFGGKSLNNGFSGSVALDADAQARHPRAAVLARWYREQGAAAKQGAKALSTSPGSSGPPQSISEMKEDAMALEIEGSGALPGAPNAAPTVKYATVLPATITFMPHERQPFYYACPAEVPDERAGNGKTRKCQKKTERDADGWKCAAGHCCPEPQPRWMSTFVIADHSDSMQVKAFDEITQQIVGSSAAECARLWELKDNDRDAFEKYEEICKAPSFGRWRLRLRCKKEVWNEEERLKVDIVNCEAVNHVKDGHSRYQEVLASVAAPPGPSPLREAAPFGA
jgi:replication factor A1